MSNRELCQIIESMRNVEDINEVVRALRYARAQIAHSIKSDLSPRMTVQFDTQRYGTVTGTISKINRKTIKVINCHTNTIKDIPNYSVSIQLIRKA